MKKSNNNSKKIEKRYGCGLWVGFVAVPSQTHIFGYLCGRVSVVVRSKLRQFGISQGVEDAILHTNRWLKACGSAMYRPTASERTHYCATIRPISAAPFEAGQ